MTRQWENWAVAQIEADFQRSADTHLIKLDVPSLADAKIDIYLKDESTHPTGSLKHRLARSLFLYGLSNGWIKQGSPIIEASSGSTAISEAYFARLLGLEFIAVIPKSTAQSKIAQIEFYGGRCHLVEPANIYKESQRLADELGGHYMDQFTYAERATDWRGNNNIADSIYDQMAKERFAEPRYIVMSPGTGGTSATIGRYIRYQRKATELCVVDPDNSVFFDYFNQRDKQLTTEKCSRIEGIGRPRVEPSFIANVVDLMIQVPDKATIATMHWLAHKLGRKIGASTGTNLYGVLQLAQQMKNRGEEGSIVTLLCDSGERYLDSYYCPDWVETHIGDTRQYQQQLQQFEQSGLLESEK